MTLTLPTLTSDIVSLLSNPTNSKEKSVKVQVLYWVHMCCLTNKLDMPCVDRQIYPDAIQTNPYSRLEGQCKAKAAFHTQ